ncbi:hypothetical protein LT335_00287 [Spiroplasma sp. JKS002669]|uniref:hypothetical protein n=1 Tax=Spiroplasma attinicola TaxID=2904537 RepID=UPI0020BFD497|nr:hypothetical protein [Spiroplasma sp. JKS002669]MCL6428739.1 hypothetical protein [Spiroplasma sp. JKS002669]
MGWFSLFLSKIVGLSCGKKNLITKTEIETTRKKIITTRRLYSMKSVVQNNFDLKSGILRLFFWAYWIDGVFFAISFTVNTFYTSIFFGMSFNFKISDDASDNDFIFPWIGILIISFFVVFFLIRWINDCYKLSLRSNYRYSYLKLLWLDIFTLNFLNIIGILIFLKNKKQIRNLNIDNLKINAINLNPQVIKDFSKIITKIELFILLINLILFAGAMLICYFVSINSIKFICLFFIFWTIALIQGWSFQKIAGLIIIQKMLKNLLNNNNYYYLLVIIRFLGFNFGGYYMAVFINILKFDESTKEFILENW